MSVVFEMKDAERVFGLFERIQTQENFPGSGLGLAVCKKIVEREGGKIWAESTPGRGSTFYFTIPKREAATAPLAVGNL